MSISGSGAEEKASIIPVDTSKKLLAVFFEYEKHLDSKKINVKENDPLMGEITVEKDSELRQLKRTAISALKGASGGDSERFSELYGRYKTTLEKVADFNPATNLGMKYTHGEKLTNEIKNLMPDIENNPGYLVGKLKAIIVDFLLEKKQPIERVEQTFVASDAKLSEDEKKLYDFCRDCLGNLYSNMKSYDERIQIFETSKGNLFELINKVDPKDKGFFSKLTSAVRSTPETQFKNQIKDISNKLLVINMKI